MTALMAAALAACGGGGGGGSAPPAAESPAPSVTTATGVAAVGAPISGGAVELKCASGATTSATTDTEGVWSASLKTTDYPCVARVTVTQTNHYSSIVGSAPPATTTITLHSVVAAPGTTNITPLTDLIVGILSGQDPATWFANVTNGVLSGAITLSSLGNALDKLKSTLATLPGKPVLPDGFDPLTSPFSAKKGDAADDFLESYRTALAAAGLTQEQAAGYAAAGGALTQVIQALTVYTTPNETAAFGFRGGISTNLNDQTVLFMPDPNRGVLTSQFSLAMASSEIGLGTNSPFTAGISVLGTGAGQLCMSGAGSFNSEQHSQYVYVSDALVEVTDPNELKGLIFDDYEDCAKTGTLVIDANGSGVFTQTGQAPDDADADFLSAFTSQGREETKNDVTGLTRAKAYKYVDGTTTRYVYVGVSNKKGDASLEFNGDPTYVTMGVSRLPD